MWELNPFVFRFPFCFDLNFAFMWIWCLKGIPARNFRHWGRKTLASGVCVKSELFLATRNWITPTSSKLANNLENLMKSLALAADSGESTRWITYLRLWGRNPLPTPDNLKRQSIVSRAPKPCVWWRKTNCDMKGKGIVIKILNVYCRQAWTVED